MKRVKNLLVGAVGVAALVAGSAAMAGIAATKHNLGTDQTTGNHLTGGTAEICVFCHTPHGADTAAPAPLWNRKLGSQGAAYTTYAALGTSTLDGDVLAVGSVSLACLSCHDGTQAMDSVINAPGSGGYNVNGARFGTGWTGPSVDVNGKMTTATVAMLGTDLTNDHPVGVQYGGGCADAGAYATAGYNCTTFKDPGFIGTNKSTKLVSGVTRTFWWVDTAGGTANRDLTDMILYSRTGTGGNEEPFVECASCHDPHVAAKAGTEVAFLRVSQASSGVCLACHNK